MKAREKLYFESEEARREYQRLIEENLGLAGLLAKSYPDRGLTHDELVSFGFEGLCVAARKFDPERGVKFTTYAGWWIHSMIQRGLRNNHCIRVPEYTFQKRCPRKYRDLAMKAREGFTLVDTTEGCDRFFADAGEHDTFDDDDFESLRDALSMLDERDRQVLTRRYAGHYRHAIGRDLGVCAERVAQLEKRAMDRLGGLLKKESVA